MDADCFVVFMKVNRLLLSTVLLSQCSKLGITRYARSRAVDGISKTMAVYCAPVHYHCMKSNVYQELEEVT